MAECNGVPFSLGFLISGVEADHERDEYYQQLSYPIVALCYDPDFVVLVCCFSNACSVFSLPTAPTLRYKRMWSLRKVENGHLVGDDPVPESHGATVPLEGGLLLNGNNSWLDMGNFEGQ